MKGSPVKPDEQLHIGLCVITWHLALRPQVLGQGSMHFLLTHALSCGHSELTIHSGRQDGAVPKYPTSQVHTLWPLTTLHRLLGPQGDGRQGFTGLSCLSEIAEKNNTITSKFSFVVYNLLIWHTAYSSETIGINYVYYVNSNTS